MNLCILESWGKKLLEDIAPVLMIIIFIQMLLSLAAWFELLVIACTEEVPSLTVYIFAWIGVAELIGFCLLWFYGRYEEAKDECSPNKRS